MIPPALTVAIPFHDEEERLPAAVASILGQTFRDFELLLVDDGSRDRSLAIARAVGDPRVRVLSDGRRRKLPARLNEIVRAARGDLVARMDADDVCHPTRLARQVALLEADVSLDAVGTWAGLVDDDDEILGVTESPPLPATPRVALERGVFAHATMVARRAWLEQHPYDEQMTRAEDRDLWCRTVTTSRFAIVGEPLYVVRIATRSEAFLPKYLESQRQNRELYRRYGPRFVGRGRTFELRAGAHAKSVVVRSAVAAGFASALVRRRARPATAGEHTLIREALDRAPQRA